MLVIYGFVLLLMVAGPTVLLLAYKRGQRRVLLAVIAGVLTLVFSVPGYFAYPVAHGASKQSAVGGYWQTLGSTLVSADPVPIRCEKNGKCVHVDPWCDPVPHSEDIKDSKGNVTGHRTWTTYSRCPFMTYEYNFNVTDSLGNVTTIASHWFAAQPEKWHSFGISVNRSRAGSVSRGIPAKWQALKDRINSSDAPPGAVIDVYENYILGSEADQYREHSADIKTLKDHGLLPRATTDPKSIFTGPFTASKVEFLGGMSPPGNQAIWQDYLMHFDAAFGMESTHGDLRIATFKASAVEALGIAPEDYIRAYKAYRQSAAFGKNAIPKNVVVLALALDDSGTMIRWARAETGMPIGNHEMLDALALRVDNTIPFDPDRVLGKTTARITRDGGKNVPVYTLGGGVVTQIMMTDHRFLRACMKCDDKEDAGQQGFISLEDLIPISVMGVFLAVLCLSFIMALLLAAAMGAYYLLTGNTPRWMQSSKSDIYPYDSRSYGY